MRLKSVTQWRGRVKSGGLDIMTVRGLGQEPAAITISSKGYTILTHVTCSVHFWTYICHQNTYLIFVNFGTPPHYLGLYKVHQKVCKFVTK